MRRPARMAHLTVELPDALLYDAPEPGLDATTGCCAVQ